MRVEAIVCIVFYTQRGETFGRKIMARGGTEKVNAGRETIYPFAVCLCAREYVSGNGQRARD